MANVTIPRGSLTFAADHPFVEALGPGSAKLAMTGLAWAIRDGLDGSNRVAAEALLELARGLHVQAAFAAQIVNAATATEAEFRLCRHRVNAARALVEFLESLPAPERALEPEP